jgi:hypothetical protein
MPSSPYFDGCYFDPTYFDAAPCSTGGRPAKGIRRLVRRPEPEPLDEAEEFLAWIP